jgi:uroporphyrinogen-III synthase
VTVRLLLTRPEPDAEITAGALRARGHSVMVASLLRIEAIANPAMGAGPWAAVVVTSGNAARVIVSHARFVELKGLPAFAVGERSAQAMRNAGFAAVTSAGGDIEDLVTRVAEHMKPPSRLLYLAGEDRAGDLAGALCAKNFAVDTIVVYRAIVADILPTETAAALTDALDGVLHYSRRSAEGFLTAASNSGVQEAAVTRPIHFCLSAQVAEPLVRAGAAHIRMAAQPNEAALLELLPVV